nr:Nramp family divalent metal transporter [uncultured Cupriavidus sp.]
MATTRNTLTERVSVAAYGVLAGERHGPRALLSLGGPAVVASIAYMDPGNFATNIQAGARYGYSLLWVVVFANGIAMLFQMLSAKLGIVTGRNLAELCRDTLPRPLVIVVWLLSEVAAMATDLAEFVGASIGLSLLMHLPLMAGMLVTAVATCVLLQCVRAGFRPLELMIAGLVGVIGASYLTELLIAPIAWSDVFRQALVPHVPDQGALVISVGIVGATVMPHALFLHSGLTQNRIPPRNEFERARLLRFSNIEVVVALGIAGLINMAMVIMASGAFHDGHPGVAQIETAYQTLSPLLGSTAALLFLSALIASGISSSVVGTVAGQMIMQGFVRFRIPVWLRRLVTIIPAFFVIGSGVDPTEALVLSQVVLSIALPVPMGMLVWYTSRRALMGPHQNSLLTIAASGVGALVVLTLNMVLVVQAFSSGS